MNNFTLAQKQYLETQLESGHQVIYVAYNPATIVGTPEQNATSAGFVEYYRESSATLVEIIYTK